MQRQAKNLLELRQWLQDIHDHGLQANGVLLISDNVFRSFVKSFDAMLGTQGYELSPDSALKGDDSTAAKLQQMNDAVRRFNKAYQTKPVEHDEDHQIAEPDYNELGVEDDTGSATPDGRQDNEIDESDLIPGSDLIDDDNDDGADNSQAVEAEKPLNDLSLLNGSAVDEAKKQSNATKDKGDLTVEDELSQFGDNDSADAQSGLNSASQTLEDALPTSHQKQVAPGWERPGQEESNNASASDDPDVDEDGWEPGETLEDEASGGSQVQSQTSAGMFSSLGDEPDDLPDNDFDAGEIASKTVSHSVGSSVNSFLDSKEERQQAAMNKQIQTSVSTDSDNDSMSDNASSTFDDDNDLPDVEGDKQEFDDSQTSDVNDDAADDDLPEGSNQFGDADDDTDDEDNQEDLTDGGLGNLLNGSN